MKTQDNRFWVYVICISAGFFIAAGFAQSQLKTKVDAIQSAEIAEHEIKEHATPRETGIIISTDIKYIKKELSETHNDIREIKKIIISKLANEE